MELAIYIKELLYNNDILIIPGFGGFRTNYRAAEINTEEHSIAPPMKYLVYDKELVTSDEMLVLYVAKQKKVTKKSAEKFVKLQVEAIHKKLNNGETILLEGIGYFSKENEVIRFERDHDSNFLTDSYGLSKIDFKPVEVTIEPQLIPNYSPTSRSTLSKVLWIIGGMLLLACIGVAIYIYYPSIQVKFFTAKSNKHVITNPVATIDTTAGKNLIDTAKRNDLEKFFDSKTNKKKALAIDSATKVKPSTGKSYFIIAGSFKTFQRATILSKKLQKDGFKPEVLQFSEDTYRVSLGEFGDKAEALAECDKIHNSKGNMEVWLLSK